MSTTTTKKQHRVLPNGTVYALCAADSRLSTALASVLAAVQPKLKLQQQPSVADLLSAWEQSKGAVPEAPVLFTYEAVIIDGTVDAADGAIAYALFSKKIPVVVLVASDADECAYLSRYHTSPLLKIVVVTTEDEEKDALKEYFTGFTEKPGRVIVIEGGDGAGKQTQTALLLKHIREELGQGAVTVDFPHDAARYGVLIREALAGHKGPLSGVSPLVFGSLYGLNRHDLKPWIDNWLQRGVHIVFDRWTTANYGHQASKFKTDAERDSAIAALRTFEVQWLGLPDADRVFYLDLPPMVAYEAMMADTTRKELDLHEKAGIEYKENVRRAFLWCCQRFSDSWRAVPCYDEVAKKRFEREDVHGVIVEACKELF